MSASVGMRIQRTRIAEVNPVIRELLPEAGQSRDEPAYCHRRDAVDVEDFALLVRGSVLKGLINL